VVVEPVDARAQVERLLVGQDQGDLAALGQRERQLGLRVAARAGFGLDGSGDETLEKLGDAVIARIAEWAGIPDLATRVVLRRTVGPGDFADDLNAWKGTALGPAHILKQSAFFRPGNMSKKVRGLYYVGSSTIPGIGLPMCLISAEVLVKRLRGDTTAGPLPEPLRPPVSGPVVRTATGRALG
jgi:phytoene dehydrogenase-like protein